MYGKIFESIYDGTLADDWRGLITFQQFIILCNPDGMIDMTPQAISRRTGIPIEHIKAGIDILEKPDKYSRTEGQDGRRIELIDPHRSWGWHIVNHEKYRNMKDMDTVRAQTRERVRKHRERKIGNVTSVTISNAEKRHTDTDTDTDTDTNTNTINQKKASPVVIPESIDKETWKTFVEHRQKLKAPMTDRAKTLMFNKLDKLNGNNNDILNQSIENGWKGIFGLKEDNINETRGSTTRVSNNLKRLFHEQP